MSYGYVYVAQVAMGANQMQTLKALREAEAYHGPSLVICYAPCINHGIKVNGGMKGVMTEEKRAVECGYYNLFRFNPAAEGKKLTVDYTNTKPEEYQDFLNGEVRYMSLRKSNPDHADDLYAQSALNAKEHLSYLERLEKLYDTTE